MSLTNKRIGVGFTGSHSTYHLVFPQLQFLMEQGAEVVPVVTDTVKNKDTKYGKAKDHIATIESNIKKKIISTIQGADPLITKKPLNCMVVTQLTGNSLSKIATEQTDYSVLMASKANLRNRSHAELGIRTSDTLSIPGV